MNPLRLTARNYRSFSDLDVTFPEGCTAVIGPNGAGKSTIVGAIDLALFGARSLGDYLTEGIDEPLQIKLEFEHRGELYRVRRTYSSKGRGQSKLDLEHRREQDDLGIGVVTDYGWEPLTRESQAATQSLIEEILGLSRQTFRASAFLSQGDSAAFTEADPRTRKAILAEVLGLGIWDELLQLAKTGRGRLEQTGNRLQAELERAHAELGQQPLLEAKRSELGERVERLLAEVARLEARKQELEHAIGACEGAAREQQRITARLSEIVAQTRNADTLVLERDRLTAAAPDIDRLQKELSGAIERERARAEYDRLFMERARLIGEANELNEKAHLLREDVRVLEERGPGSTLCELCHQTLGAEALQSTVANMRGKASQFDEQAKRQVEFAERVELPAYEPTMGRSPEDIQPELHLAQNGSRRLAEVRAALERVGELTVEQSELTQQLADLGAVPDLAALENERVGVVRDLDAKRGALDSDRQQLAVVDAKLAELAELAHTTEGTAAGLRAIQAELDVVLLAERAYGRDGIPALIVENAAIPQIETEANRILAELGTSFTIELRTQRALKSGEGLKESLDIVVAGPIGARPYETFSGGERTRLNLALRIALARLLAHRRGAEVRMLAIDEPEFLDEAGVARLAEVLRGLSADFDRILLVSHVPGLRDAFDQALEVEKVGERSRLVGAPEREEVLA